MRRAATAAAILLLCMACASPTPAATDSPAPSSPTTTTTSPSPTPTTWTREEAAARYLEMVEPGNACIARYNDLLDTLETGYHTSEFLASLNEIASECKAAEAQLISDLQGGLWPSDAQEAIADMVLALQGDQVVWKAHAGARTMDDHFDAPPFSDSKRVTDLVRAHLGLGPVA